jgi:hypothetical protein
MTTITDIKAITIKEEAFALIDQQGEWDSRKKAAVRYAWRQKHEPTEIERCPAKGERATNKTKKIDRTIDCFATKEERLKKCEEVHENLKKQKKDLATRIQKMVEAHNKIKEEMNEVKEKYQKILDETTPKEEEEEEEEEEAEEAEEAEEDEEEEEEEEDEEDEKS